VYRLLLVLLIAGIMVADQPKQQLTEVERARTHAEQAHGKGEAKAYAELIRKLVDESGTLYAQQKYDEALKDLDEANEAIGKVRTSVEEKKHDVKQCDLILSHVERRLKDYDHSFSTQDRSHVQTLLKNVQGLRDRLLQILFETK
jgi:hypothetical protein